VRYTIVDDNNFQQTGLSEKQSLHRFVVRSDSGEILDIFPINAALRRSIPFRSPEDALAHIRSLADDGGQLIVFADDGEKLGEWPGTHTLVYQQGWLERFFQLVSENRAWLEVTTLAEALQQVSAHGPISLPPGSYEEMMAWSGGDWANFLRRYPESNLLYRKMRLVSDMVADAGSPDVDAREFLYRGQANDPYWHGAFGGIYLLHLRTGAYRNLLSAERTIGRDNGIRVTETDYDGDGRTETLVSAPLLNLYLHRLGGQVFELDDCQRAWNLLASMSRRHEPYHDELGDSEQGRRLLPVHYDWYPRRALIDHFLRGDTSLDAFADCNYGEQGDFVDQPYQVELDQRVGACDVVLTRRGGVWVGKEFTPVTVRKQVTLRERETAVTVRYQIEHDGDVVLPLWFATESNFVLSAGNAPGRYYQVQRQPRGSLEAKADFGQVSEVALVDEWLGAKLCLRFPGPTGVWVFPIQTVSRGLEGPTYSYQGSSVTAHWHIDLHPGTVWSTSFVIEIMPIT
jgi:alpha-amylase